MLYKKSNGEEQEVSEYEKRTTDISPEIFSSISVNQYDFRIVSGKSYGCTGGGCEENTMITGFVAVYPDWNDNGEPSFPTDPYYKTEFTGQENEYKITRTEGSILLIQTVVVKRK